MSVGLALRWSASGMMAVQVSPCQACVQSLPDTAAVWIRSVTSGKNSSVLPRAAGGRPSIRIFSVLPATSTVPVLTSATGSAACAASNAALCRLAVEPCTGSLTANWPSSGIHSCRHTSQDALSRMSALAGAGQLWWPGWKSARRCSGTGSSTVFS